MLIVLHCNLVIMSGNNLVGVTTMTLISMHAISATATFLLRKCNFIPQGSDGLIGPKGDKGLDADPV